MIRQYYPTGEIWAEIPANGRGFMKEYYQSGALMMEVPVKNGVMEGLSKEYYENGQLKGEGRVVAGKFHGLFTEYYESGQLKAKTQYQNNQRVGLKEEYYKSGQMKSQENYRNNQLDGLVQIYHVNGRVQTLETYWQGKRITVKTFDERGQEMVGPFPKNLEDCLVDFKSRLSTAQLEELKGQSEQDIRQGVWKLKELVENRYLLWGESDLANYFKNLEVYGPEDMSAIILVSLHRQLNNQAISLNGQIDYFKGNVFPEDMRVDFKLVCEDHKEGCMKVVTEDDQQVFFVHKESELNITDIDSARIETTGVPQYQTHLILKFNEDGKRKVQRLTAKNLGKRLSLFIDQKLIMTPKIYEPITGDEFQVVGGNISEQDLRGIAWRINREKYGN